MGYPARFRRGHCTRSRANRLLALTTKGVDAALLSPRVPLDGARYTLELITQRSPAGKSAPVVEHFVDNSIVDELEREGFFKKLAARR